MLIEHFERQANGQWLMTEVVGLESELHIASIECRLKLADVYNHVEFSSPDEAEEANEESNDE